MFHLTQLNISKLLKPIDHPQIAEFVDNLDRINAIAESSPGFVWRLKDDSGNATGVSAFEDPMVIVNMSVWESVEDLKSFAFHSDHIEIMRKRNQWFEKPTSRQLVMWWIRKGNIPTVQEAKERLNYLEIHGETPRAFSFRRIFPPD